MARRRPKSAASVPKWEWPTWSLAHGRKILYKVKWPISGHCLARSGLHAPSAKTKEPRALALQSLTLLGILFQQEEVGVEDSMLLGSKN